ncbi:hypothetical protein [Trichocoleus sp. FACHB-262]|uniref:hypothetical protein n=1 Tax=Trichocoleus sp. FACHB-262 TaxID=2692869 RepID=UPI00168612F7|nr:hypothetical protein [Trichocoleus sp. FACHB-262]MBD2120051.1 hypothetical protein [Trichocoleus sp. FACHB-262]
MFGFIKKLINGILAFVTSFLNKKSSADAPSAVPQPKRKSGYFMEFDDSSANGQPAKIEAAKAEPVKTQPAKVEAPKAPEPAAQPGKAEARKAAKAEAAKTEATPPAPAQPAPVATNNQNGQKQSEPAIAFSSFGDRRRPGPNMSSFLDMARQVKVPT